jgi:hypothetical protein
MAFDRAPVEMAKTLDLRAKRTGRAPEFILRMAMLLSVSIEGRKVTRLHRIGSQLDHGRRRTMSFYSLWQKWDATRSIALHMKHRESQVARSHRTMSFIGMLPPRRINRAR